MKDHFESYHPLVSFLYFGLVIAFSISYSHPLAQCIALTGAIVYEVSVHPKQSLLFILKFCLPMLLLTAFINPAFNHEGKTFLLYFPNGNPLTLESVLYGLSAGCMLTTVLLWFSAFNRVMTSDKFIYLFGKIIPALSLILSMTLRFVPKFKTQLQVVTDAQRSIGRDVSSGSVFSRVKTAIVIFSIMITWALENAIETADSMKSRGYGLKGRTAFTIYRLDERDCYALLWFGFCGLFLLCGSILQAFGFRFFPDIRYATIDRTTIPFYFIYLFLCITPSLLNWREERKWKTLTSGM